MAKNEVGMKDVILFFKSNKAAHLNLIKEKEETEK
jgi:hypothetical protein